MCSSFNWARLANLINSERVRDILINDERNAGKTTEQCDGASVAQCGSLNINTHIVYGILHKITLANICYSNLTQLTLFVC